MTTILKTLPAPGLPRWAAKLTAETAVEKFTLLASLIEDDPQEAVKWLKGSPWAVRDRAGNLGTAIHSLVEVELAGGDPEELIAKLPIDARRKAEHALAFFRTEKPIIHYVEYIVYHDRLGYAGTADFMVTIPDLVLPGTVTDQPGSKIVLDLKTGNGVYEDTALQLAAYRYAEHMVDLENAELLPVPETDGAAVLWVNEDGWELIPMDAGEDTFKVFEAACQMAGVLPLSRELKGTPIRRGHA